jgi:hypothetical protein
MGAFMPESARVASTRRRDSGSPLQASAMPPLVRIDEIRFLLVVSWYRALAAHYGRFRRKLPRPDIANPPLMTQAV